MVNGQVKLVHQSTKEEFNFEPASSPLIIDDSRDGVIELPVKLTSEQQQQRANKSQWQQLAGI